MNLKQCILLLQKNIHISYGYKNTFSPTLSLLESLIGKSPEWILANLDYCLTKREDRRLKEFLTRIEKKEPIQYISGYTQFYGLAFNVSKNIFIPRPTTETLVETAVKWIKENREKWRKKRMKIIDIGTGSGCIIVSVVNEVEKIFGLSGFRFYATDISLRALKVAKENARKILGKNAVQITFIKSNLFDTRNCFGIVLANLPYLSEKEWERLPPHIKNYEPKNAILGGKTGKEIIEKFLKALPRHLEKEGVAVLEAPPHFDRWLKRASKRLGFTLRTNKTNPFIKTINLL